MGEALESAGRRPPRSDRTFEQLAKEMGIALETLQRLFVAFGLPRPTGEERVREEALEAIKAVPLLFGAGIGPIRCVGETVVRTVKPNGFRFGRSRR